MSRLRSKPLIGLTGRRVPGQNLGFPFGFFDAPVDAYLAEYGTSVIADGGLPVHIPLDLSPRDAAELVDGLVLTGGDDVDPSHYGQAVGPGTLRIDPKRDVFEFDLFKQVRELGKPILGICRGAQLINVALGGSLIRDLPVGVGDSHASYAYPRAHRRHEVECAEGSIARELYGERVSVNSFHHQAVDRLGASLRVTGIAPDGVIEATESLDRMVLGLQWHPECFGADPAFAWLVEAARQNANRRSSVGSAKNLSASSSI